MKLVVGLGNVGEDYENTRHNVGFMCIDAIAKHFGAPTFKEKMHGLETELNINGEKIILLKPAKYMNLSGEVIREYVNFFKIDIEDILIFSDDLDMPLGKMKLKYKGSSGGHNGLKNISLNLHTEDFKRVKIGISNDKDISTVDYVLGRFSKEEKEILNDTIKVIPNLFEDYLNMPFDNVMNKYNKK